MSAPHFSRIAVLGLGLLGGSVALAARRAGLADEISGSTRRRHILEAALRDGVIDAAGSFEEVVEGAELVVLSTPIFAMPEILGRAAERLAPGTLVTDVGSVKGPLVDLLAGLLPPGVEFVGSHPMAGGHEQGMEAARADLFDGAACAVTHSPNLAAMERVCGFWEALGARVLRLDADEHDAYVGWTSHVPHAVAFAFAAAFASAPAEARALCGPGFRDFTRIARSSPELWGEILTANRKAIASPLQAVAQALSDLSRAIEANDTEAVERLIGTARESVTLATSSQTET